MVKFIITAYKSERSPDGVIYMKPFDPLAEETHEGTLATLATRVQEFKQKLIESNIFNSNNGFSIEISFIGKKRKPANFDRVRRSISSNYIA
jgi:hypothetical protein